MLLFRQISQNYKFTSGDKHVQTQPQHTHRSLGIYLVFQEQNNTKYGPRQRPYGPRERAQEPTTSSGTLVVPPRAPQIFM